MTDRRQIVCSPMNPDAKHPSICLDCGETAHDGWDGCPYGGERPGQDGSPPPAGADGEHTSRGLSG